MTIAPNRTAPRRTALTRSVPFWILLVGSAALLAAGAVTIAQHLGSMTKTLTDGSATGLDVYAGQSWVLVGAVLLGTGVLGLLLALTLASASALLPRAVPSMGRTAPFDPPYDEDFSDPEGALDAPALAHEIQPITADLAQGSTETEDVPTDEDTSATDTSAAETGPENVNPGDEAQNGSSGSTATATKISVK